MDPEFARDLRERMSASLGSLYRVALELLAKRPSILFSHDTSWPDIRRHSECVRETGTGSGRLRNDQLLIVISIDSIFTPSDLASLRFASEIVSGVNSFAWPLC